jgi:hypothetical protein
VKLYVGVRTQSEANVRQHWATKARRAKKQRQRVDLAWLSVYRTFDKMREKPVAVLLTRVAPRELDDDNLRGALKAVRDQVTVRLGFKNDRDPRLVWNYAQRHGAVREYAVEIELSRGAVLL